MGWHLPASTDPQQLHATINGSPEAWDSTGKVAIAIVKIENGTLTLANDSASEIPPNSFEANEDLGRNRYALRKAQPQKRNAEAATSK